MLALILSSLFYILLYRENKIYRGTTFLSVLLFLYGSSLAVSFIMSGLFGFDDFEGELLPSLYLLFIFYFWFVPYKGLQINGGSITGEDFYNYSCSSLFLLVISVDWDTTE